MAQRSSDSGYVAQLECEVARLKDVVSYWKTKAYSKHEELQHALLEVQQLSGHVNQLQQLYLNERESRLAQIAMHQSRIEEIPVQAEPEVLVSNKALKTLKPKPISRLAEALKEPIQSDMSYGFESEAVSDDDVGLDLDMWCISPDGTPVLSSSLLADGTASPSLPLSGVLVPHSTVLNPSSTKFNTTIPAAAMLSSKDGDKSPCMSLLFSGGGLPRSLSFSLSAALSSLSSSKSLLNVLPLRSTASHGSLSTVSSNTLPGMGLRTAPAVRVSLPPTRRRAHSSRVASDRLLQGRTLSRSHASDPALAHSAHARRRSWLRRSLSSSSRPPTPSSPAPAPASCGEGKKAMGPPRLSQAGTVQTQAMRSPFRRMLERCGSSSKLQSAAAKVDSPIAGVAASAFTQRQGRPSTAASSKASTTEQSKRSLQEQQAAAVWAACSPVKPAQVKSSSPIKVARRGSTGRDAPSPSALRSPAPEARMVAHVAPPIYDYFGGASPAAAEGHSDMKLRRGTVCTGSLSRGNYLRRSSSNAGFVRSEELPPRVSNGVGGEHEPVFTIPSLARGATLASGVTKQQPQQQPQRQQQPQQQGVASAAAGSWKQSDDCARCHTRFRFLFLRRHHCRQCRAAVCDGCSRHSKLLRLPGGKEWALCRVCDACVGTGKK